MWSSVVSVLAFYYNDLSSHPALINIIFMRPFQFQKAYWCHYTQTVRLYREKIPLKYVLESAKKIVSCEIKLTAEIAVTYEEKY